MKLSLSRLGFVAAVSLWATCASAAGLAPISQVFVFGDSISDTGNLFNLSGGGKPVSPPYFNGRETNGLIWSETMSNDLGVALTTYAVGGAQTGTGNVNSDDFPGVADTGLQNQVGQFGSDLGGGAADPGALYAVFAGSNNFCLTCFIPGVDDPIEFINEGVTDIVTSVLTLNALGAQKFLVFGLPDLSLTPRASGIPIPGIKDQLRQLTDGWNQALFANLPALPGLKTLDSAQVLRDVVANPAAFGLFNVTDACLAVGCNTQTKDPLLDPDGFLFWDDIHPTRATHAILSDIAYHKVLIPVPPAVLLFGSALGLLTWVRRRAA